MFEYYKGYEIDGSDTSYDLLTPNFEKLKEMFLFLMNLKVVDKKKPITITNIKRARGAKSELNKAQLEKELIGKEYWVGNYEELFEDILKYDLDIVSIRYFYIALESLYPEIKRDVIDTLLNTVNKHEKLDYINPILSGGYFYRDKIVGNSQVDEITIKKRHSRSEVAHFMPVNFTETTAIESYELYVDVSIVHGGVSKELAYYVLEKLSKRFPEYDINSLEDFNDMLYWGEINPKECIFESIRISRNDIFTIMDNKQVQFFEIIGYNELNNIQSGYLQLSHVYNYKSFDELTYDDDNSDNQTDTFDFGKKVHAKNYNLHNIVEKHKKNNDKYLTVNEYIEAAEALSNLKILNKAEVRMYTSTYFRFTDNKTKKDYECKVRINIDNGKSYFELVCPYDVRTTMCSFLKK